MTFKVGDKVFSRYYGEGVVERLGGSYDYLINVIFDAGWKACFTNEGNYLKNCITDQDIKLKEKKMSYFPCKIKVNSPLESKAIQEWLFEQGMKWAISGKQGMYTDKPYLYCDGYYLEFGEIPGNFANCSYPELKFSFVTNVVVESVISPPVELVELNGKKYKKEDLETALKHIKPVGE